MPEPLSFPPPPKRGPVLRGLLALLRGVLTVFVVVDELLRPLYRPLLRWIAGLRVMKRLEETVAGLPRPLVLVALAVPFAIAEPLKIFGLVLFAREQFWAGLAVTAFAHLMSFVFVERIYEAGREKLLSYPWFAWIMGQVVRVRDRVLGWVRATAAYGFAVRVRDRARDWWRTVSA
ncbi:MULTISPECIES: hypothetical protein [unclassified Bosea (in: a-proteobacteria)]|uniref:hypothetical protein n=1 Tax=unclassified Bosea (in: a-proteobacteria) TaxID=2653178 RepID=UPI00095413FA|nr:MULTISPECIES: hypothetical protein [unclassified Bosea (in: a-proteobacteria)]TAJ30635.1 MAG: hypothetical protein EPO59_11375 [Bosea sp. (in: a-proteobacteria)]SIQ86240.1 hypothetical protein SAMN05880592_10694 [Bosea sp. TND4EK4]